jgi:hypothetical protein
MLRRIGSTSGFLLAGAGTAGAGALALALGLYWAGRFIGRFLWWLSLFVGSNEIPLSTALRLFLGVLIFVSCAATAVFVVVLAQVLTELGKVVVAIIASYCRDKEVL